MQQGVQGTHGQTQSENQPPGVLVMHAHAVTTGTHLLARLDVPACTSCLSVNM